MKIFIIMIAIIVIGVTIFTASALIYLNRNDELSKNIISKIDVILDKLDRYDDEYEFMIKLIISFLHQFITDNTNPSLYRLGDSIIVNFLSGDFYYVLSVDINEYLHVKLIKAISSNYSLDELDKSLRELISNVEFKLVRYRLNLEENKEYVDQIAEQLAKDNHDEDHDKIKTYRAICKKYKNYPFHMGEKEYVFWNNFTMPMNPIYSDKTRLKLLEEHCNNNHISLINDIRVIEKVSMHVEEQLECY